MSDLLDHDLALNEKSSSKKRFLWDEECNLLDKMRIQSKDWFDLI
jgi:hypothetical protein